MNRGRWMKAALAGAVALLATAASGAGENWNTRVERVDGGHLIGNPDAPRLTEYVSYTCPHCAHFTQEGEQPIKLAYVSTGKMQLEIRHLVRDPVDLTAAVLANCGPVSRFPLNHSAFMMAQDEWMEKASSTTEAQRKRWAEGQLPARLRAIASDLGFYRIMERRGYTRADADRCLNDEKAAERIADISAKDWKTPGITGTPTFAINGSVLASTHSWSELEPQLRSRF